MTPTITSFALDKHYIDLQDLLVVSATVSNASFVVVIINGLVLSLKETSPDTDQWHLPVHAMLAGEWTGMARLVAVDLTDNTSVYSDDTEDLQIVTSEPVEPLEFLINLYKAHLEYHHPLKSVAFVTPYSDKMVRLTEYQKVRLEETGRPSKRVGLHHYKQVTYNISVEIQSNDSYKEVALLFDDLLRIEEQYRNEMGNYHYDLIIPQDDGENRSVVGKYIIAHKVTLLKDLQRVRELDI